MNKTVEEESVMSNSTNLDEKPVRREEAVCKRVDNEIILYNASTKYIHVLNNAGAMVWDLCDGQHDILEIVNEIVENFDINAVNKNIIYTDICEIIDKL